MTHSESGEQLRTETEKTSQEAELRRSWIEGMARGGGETGSERATSPR